MDQFQLINEAVRKLGTYPNRKMRREFFKENHKALGAKWEFINRRVLKSEPYINYEKLAKI